MKRNKFILGLLSLSPVAAMANFRSFFLREKKGFKVPAGESRNGEHLKMKGVTLNTLDLKVSGKDTDGDIAIFEQLGTTPKGGPPLHIHPFQDEMFYVIDGEYRFQVGDDSYELKSGDTIFLPRGIKHAFIQLTEKGKLIITYQPAGKIEDFFKTTSLWTSPPSQDEISKVFEDHDMKIVGPPLKV
ncbi:MAG: cupin domain-containing protein [Chitinophagaceae bacterium]